MDKPRRYKASELEIKGRSLAHAIKKRTGEKVLYSCGLRVMKGWLFSRQGGVALTRDMLYVLEVNPFTGDRIVEIPRGCIFDVHIDPNKRELVVLRYADGPVTRLLKLNSLWRSGLATTEEWKVAFAKASALAEVLEAFLRGELTPELGSHAEKEVHRPKRKGVAANVLFFMSMIYILLLAKTQGNFRYATSAFIRWVVLLGATVLVFKILIHRAKASGRRKRGTSRKAGEGPSPTV